MIGLPTDKHVKRCDARKMVVCFVVIPNPNLPTTYDMDGCSLKAQERCAKEMSKLIFKALIDVYGGLGSARGLRALEVILF